VRRPLFASGAAAVLAPAFVAAGLAAAYVAIAPASADLAAQIYRAGVFSHRGFAIWDGQWYGGHHLAGYSLLFPPLAGLLGARVVAGLSSVIAALLFERLVRAHFGERARWGALWFGAATAVNLLTGRLTFALGVCIGLGALLAAQRGRRGLALLLAAATPLGSPVAGAFLVLAGAAWAIGESASPRAAIRHVGAALGAAAAGTWAVLAIGFPEGGTEPFSPNAFWPVVIGLAIALFLVPRRERTLRVGIALYALGCIAAFALSTPMGGNAVRLGALVGGPLAACLLPWRRPLALAAVALPLLYWQWAPPVRDVAAAHGDPSVKAEFYAPLLEFLDRQPGGPFRTEIVATRNHWEAAHVAPRYPLARGWERQLDTRYDAVFYERPLSPDAYRKWLDDNAVRFVALPSAPLDYAARPEAALLRHPPAYLRLAFQDADWKVFAVRRATPLVTGPATLVSMGPDRFVLSVDRPGMILAKVRYTPYWAMTAGRGCVQSGDDGWTRVRADSPGRLVVSIRFSATRLVARGARCT
jgi:hypothetical protein